jgi:hypothetical protein
MRGQKVNRQPDDQEDLEQQVRAQGALVEVRRPFRTQATLDRGGKQAAGAEGNRNVDLDHGRQE